MIAQMKGARSLRNFETGSQSESPPVPPLATRKAKVLLKVPQGRFSVPGLFNSNPEDSASACAFPLVETSSSISNSLTLAPRSYGWADVFEHAVQACSGVHWFKLPIASDSQKDAF